MARTAPRDYYEVLGVGRDARPEEIKSAYRKAALRWHPDRNPDKKQEAEARFREATEAYSVLSDPQKRAAYDRYGHAGVSPSAGGGFDPRAYGSIFDEFQDIFGDFFGFEEVFGSGRARRNRPQRGADLRYDMRLKFEEAARGVRTRIKVPRLEICEVCRGTGARGSGASTCKSCGGRGQVRYQQGFFSVTRTCPACRGEGQVITDPCPKCHGQGRVEAQRTVEIRIPAGVDHQTRVRIPGEGEAGIHGGPPGDLYVVLEVEEHPFFERRGADLYCTIPVNVAQAALGTRLSVPTLNGDVSLEVPAGAQSGSVFRLKGKGLPDPHNGSMGDLYVHLQVVIPEKLTREQKRLFEELAATLSAENRPAERSSGFFQKVKDIFG